MKILQTPDALGCAARPLSGGAWGKRGEKKKEGLEGKNSSPIPPFLFACPPKRAAFFGAELCFLPPLVTFPDNFCSIDLQ